MSALLKAALFLALEAVRVWQRLPVPGRIITSLFILLGTVSKAYDALLQRQSSFRRV